MKPYTKDILQSMTPKAAAQAVFSNDPDSCNPFEVGTQDWLDFGDELYKLGFEENGH